MKLAFLILVHKNPGQVLRLIDRLNGPGAWFFVHVDRRAPESVFTPLESRASVQPNVFCTPRHLCRWGNFGIVEATLACIREALRRSADFDYGILLSGQDYPLKPLSKIEEYLGQHNGAEFIEAFRLDQPNRWTPMGGQYQAMNKVQWYTLHVRGRRVHIPLRRGMPLAFQPFGGSQWWSLSRECLAYVAEQVSSKPALASFFRHVFIPDESFFHMIVANSRFAPRIIPDDLHFIDWNRPNPGAPRTFEGSDFEELKSSGKLFCRKVDVSHDARILDLLDQHILSQIDPHTGL